MTEANNRVWLVAAFLINAALFTLWPGIDIWVSDLFWTPELGFWVTGYDWTNQFREALWKLMASVFIISALAWLVSAIWRPVFRISAKIWGYIALLFFLGPGLIVNALLKEIWGRARPASVVEFGGTRTFTAPLDITDQCASNCSFVSGEGAGATALAYAALILSRQMKNRTAAVALLWVVWPLAFVAMALRVAMGRHFLSDTIFAFLIVAALALILTSVLRLGNHHALAKRRQ